MSFMHQEMSLNMSLRVPLRRSPSGCNAVMASLLSIVDLLQGHRLASQAAMAVQSIASKRELACGTPLPYLDCVLNVITV